MAPASAFPEPLPGETEPYVVWGLAQARPGMGNVLAERLLALVEPSRAEPGALEYHVHRDRRDPDLFALYEAWASLDDLRAHLASPMCRRSCPNARSTWRRISSPPSSR